MSGQGQAGRPQSGKSLLARPERRGPRTQDEANESAYFSYDACPSQHCLLVASSRRYRIFRAYLIEVARISCREDGELADPSLRTIPVLSIST